MWSSLKQFIRSAGRRWIPALVLFALSSVALVRSLNSEVWFAAVPGLLLGMALLVAGAVCVAPSIATAITERVVNFFLPSEKFDRPLPLYGPAEALRRRHRFEEAMAAYQQIAEAYPDEPRPYLEMMEIAVLNLRDPSRAKLIQQQGLEVMAEEKNREQLTRFLEKLCSRN